MKNMLILAIAVISITSCQKDGLERSIAGTWEGYWGFDQDTPTHYEKWEIKKNGDLVAYNANGTVIGNGSWELNDFNFEAEYDSEFSDNNYTFVGLYSDAGKEIIGNWGETPSSTNGGTFEMHEQ